MADVARVISKRDFCLNLNSEVIGFELGGDRICAFVLTGKINSVWTPVEPEG